MYVCNSAGCKGEPNIYARIILRIIGHDLDENNRIVGCLLA